MSFLTLRDSKGQAYLCSWYAVSDPLRCALFRGPWFTFEGTGCWVERRAGIALFRSRVHAEQKIIPMSDRSPTSNQRKPLQAQSKASSADQKQQPAVTKKR